MRLRFRRLFIFFLVMTFYTNFLFGEKIEKSGETFPITATEKISETIRYFPYQDIKQVFEGKPPCVIISRETYEDLKNAKEAYLGKQPLSPLPGIDLDYSFGKATYKGFVKDRVGEFTFSALVDLPNDKWVMLPLPSGDLGYINVSLDGEPIGLVFGRFSESLDSETFNKNVILLQKRFNSVFQEKAFQKVEFHRTGMTNSFAVVIRGSGRHTLSARFLAPQGNDPEKNSITFKVPRISANSFEIELDKPGQFAELDRSEGTVSEDFSQNGTHVSGVFGPTDRFNLRWASKTIPSTNELSPLKPAQVASQPSPQSEMSKITESPKLYSESFSLLSFGEGYIRYESQFRVNISRSPVNSVEFFLPEGLELIDIQMKQMESYFQEVASGGRKLLCRLNSSTQGAVVFHMVFDFKMADVSQRVLVPIPRIMGTERDKGFVGVCARTTLEIKRIEEEGVEVRTIFPIDVTELPQELSSKATRPILLGFRYTSPPGGEEFCLDIIRYKDSPVLTTVIDSINATTLLETDKTSMTCLDLRIKNNGKQFLVVNLPDGSQIDSVKLNEAPVKPSQKTESTYLIPLSAENAGMRLSKFGARLVYRTNIPEIQNFQDIKFPLPSFDVSTSRIDWKLFVPESYALISMKSNLGQSLPEFIFLPFAIAEKFMKLGVQISGSWFIIFFLVVLFWISLPSSNPEFYKKSKNWKIPQKIGFLIAFVYALIVVFSIFSKQPQIEKEDTKIPNSDLQVSGPTKKNVFSDVPSSHWAYRELKGLADKGLLTGYPDDPFKSEKHVTRYALAMVTAKMLANVEQMMEKGFDKNLVAESDLQSLEKLTVEFADELALLGVKVTALEDDMQVVKEDVSSFTRKAEITNLDFTRSKEKAGKPETSNKRISETRDHGALPVEMKIPTTANSHNFFRDLIKSGEETDLNGIFIYKPIFFFVQAGFAFLGFFSFLLVFFISKNQQPFLAFLLFVGFSVGVFLLEKIVPESQNLLVLFFFLGVLVIFLERAFHWFRRNIQGPAVVVILGIFLSSNQCFGQLPQSDSGKERIIDLYVPYSQLGERIPKDSDMVILDFELYNYLKDLGVPKPDPSKFYPPVSVTFLDSALEGEVASGKVELKFRSQINLLGKGFKAIEFPHFELGIRSISIDGEEVTLARQGLIHPDIENSQQSINSGTRNVKFPFTSPDQVPNQVGINGEPPGLEPRGIIFSKKEGKVVLEAKLVKNLWLNPETREEGFQIALPPFGSGKFQLSINRLDQKVEVDPSVKVETTNLATFTLVTAFLQPSAKMNVKWRDKSQKAPSPDIEDAKKIASSPLNDRHPKVFADHEILFSVNEGSIGETDNINLKIERAPAGEFLFSVPTGTAILNVTATDLAEWSVKNSSETQILRVLLNARRMDNVNFQIEMEREISVKKVSKKEGNQEGIEVSLDFPQLISIPPKGVIERQKGYFGISIIAGEEVQVLSATGASIVDPLELPLSITQISKGFLSHAFKFLSNSTPRIKIIKHKEASIKTGQIDEAKADTLISNDGKFLTRLDLTIRNNNNQFLIFEKLKDNQRILSALVNGEPTKPGTSQTGEVYISLVRSRVLNKAFMPFGVTVFFEETIPVLEGFGSFDLTLPKCSFDISEMNWRVFSSGDYVLFKFPGGFLPTDRNKFLSPINFSDLSLGFFSNYWLQARQKTPMSNMRVILGAVEMFNMDNSSSTNLGESKETKKGGSSIGADGAGYFPVSPEILGAPVWQVFNKKLILGFSPQISFCYFNKDVFQLLSLVFALLICFLGSAVLIACLRGSWFFKPGIFLLFAFGVSLKLIETGFGNHFPFLEQLFFAFFEGLCASPFMALVWNFLSNDSEEEKLLDSDPGTQVPPPR